MATKVDELIPVSEVQVSPRGRNKQLDQNLLDILTQVSAKQSVRLAGTFGEVGKDNRSKISTTIRKHWREVREDTPKIDFSPEGVPQVTVRT